MVSGCRAQSLKAQRAGITCSFERASRQAGRSLVGKHADQGVQVRSTENGAQGASHPQSKRVHPATAIHYEIWKYCQSTSRVQASVLQNLSVQSFFFQRTILHINGMKSSSM